MAVFYTEIPPSLLEWLLQQKMFFVSTAPLSGTGHVNASPKGGPYFGIPSPTQFWYLDLSGSGNETISHLYEPGNGRITIMFCAYEGGPKIVRLFGKGRVLERGTGEFDDWVAKYDIKLIPGHRSIIVVDIHQVGSSCGYSVPFYDFKEFRPVLNDFFAKKEEKYLAGEKKESIRRYWAFKNAWSVDNLPGVKQGLEVARRENVKPLKKFVGLNVPARYRTGYYTLHHVLLTALVCILLGIGLGLQLPLLLDGLRSIDFEHVKIGLQRELSRITKR